ncbi:MAG: hypothetical protein KBD04_00990 [Proteobacteria bacterium]|nr:hypothetical protein [Pseudomonadota bacterium]
MQKLLRVKRYSIDQLRRQVALLNEQIDLRLLAIEKNIAYINTERLIASVNINGSDTLVAFMEQKMLQNKQYEMEREELQMMVKKLQDQLYEAYVEEKQLEKVQSQEKIRMTIEEKRRENQVMDEMATQTNRKNLLKY